MSPVEVFDKVEQVGKEWRPHPRQEDFIQLPDTIFEGFYGGAAGGGKTDVLLMLPLLRRFHEHPKFHGVLFRKTFPQLEESLIHRSRTGIGENGPTYYDFGGKYNDQKHTWTFPSGAAIRLSYLDKDDDARQHDTAEYHYAGFDELTHFSRFVYTYITSRVRTSSKSLPAIVRSASNPGNIGHAWVRERFVEPCRQGGKILLVPLEGTNKTVKAIFIPAKLTDNPYLERNDPGYATRLHILPAAERKAKLDGDWYTFFGQVFTEFRDHHFPGEPENALHVIPSFRIPFYWPKVLAVDWGHRAMVYALWTALSPDNRAFAYREYSNYKMSVHQWSADLARLSQFDENLVEVTLDPSAWQERGHGKTIADLFTEGSGFVPTKADNDRLGGKQIVHEFLRWEPRPERYIPKGGYDPIQADRIFRMHGTRGLSEYNKLFQPDPPETNIPRFQIFEDCPLLTKTLQLCVYNDESKLSKKKIEDVKEFNGDDPYDTLRYNLKAIDAYLNQARDEHNRFQQIGQIVEQLKTDDDWTSYHIRMEALERANRQPISVPRRRSGGRFGSTLRSTLR